MSSGKLSLKWDDYGANISGGLRELRDNKDFFDVTLAYDDGQISAHKVIISACSSFFLDVLRRNPQQHPLLYLEGVRYTNVKAVLDFMYHGEVSINEEDLESFLTLAKNLRVKGLTQGQGGLQTRSSDQRRDEVTRPGTLSSASRAEVSHQVEEDDDIQVMEENIIQVDHTQYQTQQGHTEEMAGQNEEAGAVEDEVDNGGSGGPGHNENIGNYEDGDVVHNFDTGDTGEDEQMDTGGGGTVLYKEENDDNSQYDDTAIPEAGAGQEVVTGQNATENEDIYCYEDFGKFLTHNRDGSYSCGLCTNIKPSRKTDALIHIENKHFFNVFSYQCPQCSTVLGSKQALSYHKHSYHKK